MTGFGGILFVAGFGRDAARKPAPFLRCPLEQLLGSALPFGAHPSMPDRPQRPWRIHR